MQDVFDITVTDSDFISLKNIILEKEICEIYNIVEYLFSINI